MHIDVAFAKMIVAEHISQAVNCRAWLFLASPAYRSKMCCQ